MSIPVPLTVRLKTRRKDMDVTAQLVDLRFRSSIPGGFATCTFSLNRPLDVQPDEIEYFGKVYVYDGRNGRTIWEGRLEDAGRAAGDRGEVWSLSATGPRAHAQDQTFPVVYVDRSLERWVRSSYSTSKAVTEVGEVDADTPALIMRANEGDALDTNWACDFIYRFMAYNGQHIARVRADIVGDGGSANYPVGIFARVNSGSALFTKKQSSVAGNSVLSANTFSSGWNNTVNVDRKSVV